MSEIYAPPFPEFDPHTHARTTDPDTSHDAAETVTHVAVMRARVYGLYLTHPEGLTDEQLLAVYSAQHGGSLRSLEARSSPRKRRSDLAQQGLLEDSGERRRLTSGRRGVVWRARR